MNRSNAKYVSQKKAYLAAREQWPPGWWKCDQCHCWTMEPELDHKQRVGMGGSPSRLLDLDNWQLLCRDCHEVKDGGMRN